MTYQFQSRSGKTDCTDLWVIKLTNQVSPSIGIFSRDALYRRMISLDAVLCKGGIMLHDFELATPYDAPPPP